MDSYELEALRLPTGIEIVRADMWFTIDGLAENLPTDSYARDEPRWNVFDGHVGFIGRIGRSHMPN